MVGNVNLLIPLDWQGWFRACRIPTPATSSVHLPICSPMTSRSTDGQWDAVQAAVLLGRME